MSNQQYREFSYLVKNDYDRTHKINGENLSIYSQDKLNELYPNKNWVIHGETFENKKRNKDNDLGRIELNEKLLYVAKEGTSSKLFRKVAGYAAVEGGGFITLLKLRLLVIIIIAGIILGAIAGSLAIILHDDNGEIIKPIDPTVLTISGTVTAGGKAAQNATLSLQYGNTEIYTATTDKNGKYLINNVKNGDYNLICTYEKSCLSKAAYVDNTSTVIDFNFGEYVNNNTSIKGMVKITDDNTPNVVVDGYAEEAMYYVEQGKDTEVTLLATLLLDENVPSNEKEAIKNISGELEMTYYNFCVLKEVYKNSILESSNYITKTKTVLEIAVPYDSTYSVATYAFRYHDDKAVKLAALDEKPTSNYTDGTYFVSSDVVYIYTNSFSTYAIGAAKTDHVVRGSDIITYSNQATIDLNTNTISFLYKHDADSTNDVIVQLYLVGTTTNLLIAESSTIPVGYQIESLKLKNNLSNLPSVGTYQGLMKIIYLNVDGSTSTNVDIPLSVAITK